MSFKKKEKATKGRNELRWTSPLGGMVLSEHRIIPLDTMNGFEEVKRKRPN